MKPKVWTVRKCVNVAIVSFLFGSIVFLISYIGMLQNVGIGSYNESVLLWMTANRSSILTGIMKLLTSAADPVVITVMISAVAAYWGYTKKEIWRPFLLVSTAIVTAIITTFIKVLTENSRPPQSAMVAPLELDFSFPSGHTLIIIITLLTVGYFVISRNATKRNIYTWVTTATLGVTVIAVSRLYLGYHWLTDVIASIGLGFMIFATVIIIDVLFRSNVKKMKY